MPRKGMGSICFHAKTPSYFSTPSTPASTPPRSFSDSTVDQIIETAAVMIMKWNPEASTLTRVTSLFHDSKREALQFIKCVKDLQKVMRFLVSEFSATASDKLAQSQTLMQIAIKRLQKELYQILSTNRAHLDPESVSTRSSRASTATSTSDGDVSPAHDNDSGESAVDEVFSGAMKDLRTISECMISSGYARECVRLYKITRKSIIDEGIYRLGVEKMSPSRLNKMDWDAIESKITKWLVAVKVAMRTLFAGERILCDRVFAFSDSIRESCFHEISADGAAILFGFPELVAKSKKQSPEKVFRVLDMYAAISGNWPEIEFIFSFQSCSAVRSQALASILRLGDSVRALVSEFESSIQKDSQKPPVPAGGGVHRLTLHLMSYLTLLADYSHIITDIFSDSPPPENPALSRFSSDVSDTDEAPAVSVRISSLILVLLCKLDAKAKHYNDVALSYLFLANNIQHVVYRARTSNLQFLLGEYWITEHEAKARQFAGSFERFGWSHVLSSLPVDPTAEMSPEEAKEKFKRFNASFMDTCRKQSSWVVSDPKLRDEIVVSISGKLVPVYREFYETHKLVLEEAERNVELFVKFTPEELEDSLSDLFFGTTGSPASPPAPARRYLKW